MCEARDGGRNGGSKEPRAESSQWTRMTNDLVRRVVIDWRMTGLFPPYGRNSGASINEMTSSSHPPTMHYYLFFAPMFNSGKSHSKPIRHRHRSCCWSALNLYAAPFSNAALPCLLSLLSSIVFAFVYSGNNGVLLKFLSLATTPLKFVSFPAIPAQPLFLQPF